MYFAKDVSADSENLYKRLCPTVKVVKLKMDDMPTYVQSLKEYRFKAIYQAIAFQVHNVVLNIDASVRFHKDADYNVSF